MASSTSGSDGSGSGGGGGGGGGGEGGGGGGGGGGGSGGGGSVGGGGCDDGGGDDSLVDLFAVLAGAHSVGGGVFGFFDMHDGNELRQLCRLIRDDVAAARWREAKTRIRAPRRVARVLPGRGGGELAQAGRPQIRDAVLCLVGITSRCGYVGIGDAGIACLTGLHTLDIGATDAGPGPATGLDDAYSLITSHCYAYLTHSVTLLPFCTHTARGGLDPAGHRSV